MLNGCSSFAAPQEGRGDTCCAWEDKLPIPALVSGTVGSSAEEEVKMLKFKFFIDHYFHIR